MISGPTHLIEQKVRSLAQPYTVMRDTESASDTYGSDRSNGYTDRGERQLYCYRETIRSEQTGIGERNQHRLQGYCLPTVDIAEDDRIQFDGAVYEIETPRPLPEHDPIVYSFNGEIISQ